MTPLSIEEFGKQLLTSGDLDPAYIAIHKAKLDQATLHRLVVAYWAFYSLGTAAKLAEIKEPKKYWAKMLEAARNEGENPDGSKPWPRGAERRHFRAEQAIRPVGEMVAKYKTATDAVHGFMGVQTTVSGRTYGSVSRAVMTHRGFGPWIAFKIADMGERVLGWDVNFDDCHLGIYKDPRQGAAVAHYLSKPGRHSLGSPLAPPDPWNLPITDEQLKDVVQEYIWRFRKFKAPPTGDRKVNVQEIETIFCKYKSHLKGHYPVGKDTREIREGLHFWMSDLAQQLSAGLPA